MHLTLDDVQKANPELFITQPQSQASFEKLTSPQSANAKSLVFVSTLTDFKLAYAKGCKAFVLSQKLKDHPDLPRDAALLFTNNVTLALAKTSDHFFKDELNKYIQGIHATAVIDSEAKVGSGVKIGANTFIGPRVQIENNVSIGANCVLEGDIKIGQETAIESLVYIGRRTQIGKHCTVKSNTSIGVIGFGFARDSQGRSHQIPQTGKVVIEDFVHIGAGCTIDRATFDETRIGEGTKMDNICHIAHNTIIGKNAILAGKFATAGSVVIGDNFLCGGRVSISDHVTICDNVQIGGASGVSNDILKPGAYAGHPLLPVKEHLKATASIGALPQIRRDITKIFSKLGISRDS